MIYDYYKEKAKKGSAGKLILGLAALVLLVLAVTANNIYMDIIQLNEIGNYSSVYITNLMYKLIFSGGSFIVIFIFLAITNTFVKKNMKVYLSENSLPPKNLPNFSIAIVMGIIGAFLSSNFFYQKALTFINSSSFGKVDSIFSQDIGYYVFQRPFLMSIYGFFSTLWFLVILYTAAYYLLMLMSVFNNAITVQDLKVKSIVRHNLINIGIFFLIKAFSYRFEKEGILYSSVVNVTGAGYVNVNLWLNYFKAAPFLLAVIVILSFIFISRGKLKKAAMTIAVYPAIWIVVSIIALVMQGIVVSPNEIQLESKYIKYNMEKTREAYKIDKIKNTEFPAIKELTPDTINKNLETKNNIRIVDYQATLDSDAQLQSNTNFYNFHNGDIINYNINGKEIPIFITAREIDKNKLPEKSYVNIMYKYTHGYGIVMNPINKLTSEGQVDLILSGLRMDSIDKNLKITEPRIYYGELTKDHVIVNAANNLNEIDYDGNAETRYNGKGGIQLSFLKRLLFAFKYGDFNMVISGYANNAKLLLNREILDRVQKSVPFLDIDKDPYIVLTNDGRLKWVIDAYTTTDYYPYSQDYYSENYGKFNYIRNSVKIIVDAYDGTVKYYIVDKNDPIIKTYKSIYPGVFSEDPIPADIAQHMRYPEELFKIQTDILKRYHLNPDADPKNITTFYTNQDLWDIAKYPENGEANNLIDIDPYYNMIKLPMGIGSKEELILMRPFTPSNKHNMTSWLAVRNSYENNGELYGDLILFNFPKNTNIYGPYQVEVKINQIDQISKDMTLWGQSGSHVFKGNLLVVPIEDSVLYIEPIYIQSAGGSSIPEVRELVVGYQKGEDFKYGVGNNLDDALNKLFVGIKQTPAAPTPESQTPGAATVTDKEKTINDILAKYDVLKKQVDELGGLINELKK